MVFRSVPHPDIGTESWTMNLLNELLDLVTSLAATPAVIGVFVTGGLLVVSRDWRINLMALAANYSFVAVLMTQVIRLEMVALKGLIGWLICLVFYFTEQQAKVLTRATGERSDLALRSWFSARVEGWRRHGISARGTFGLMAAIMVAVVAYAVSSSIPLPEVPEEIALTCYLLGGLGMLLLGLSEDPLRIGIGMLIFLSGFDLFYTALEQSLVVTGLLGSLSFVIALGAAYLKTAQAANTDTGRGR